MGVAMREMSDARMQYEKDVIGEDEARVSNEFAQDPIEERVKNVVKDYATGNFSYRSLANKYGVSATTIKDDLTFKAPRLGVPNIDAINTIISGRGKATPEEILIRIKKEIILITKESKTIAEVAHLLNVSEKTVCDDLSKRVKNLMNEQEYFMVKLELRRHSLENLRKGNDSYLTQSREDGKFIKVR